MIGVVTEMIEFHNTQMFRVSAGSEGGGGGGTYSQKSSNFIYLFFVH